MCSTKAHQERDAAGALSKDLICMTCWNSATQLICSEAQINTWSSFLSLRQSKTSLSLTTSAQCVQLWSGIKCKDAPQVTPLKSDAVLVSAQGPKWQNSALLLLVTTLLERTPTLTELSAAETFMDRTTRLSLLLILWFKKLEMSFPTSYKNQC